MSFDSYVENARLKKEGGESPDQSCLHVGRGAHETSSSRSSPRRDQALAALASCPAPTSGTFRYS
jgi:hypothetical protein